MAIHAPPPTWSTACPDWAERIAAGKSLIPFDPLFPTEAAAAMDVFADLQIVDAPGSPRFGDTARPWVLDFASAIFGAYDTDAGRRLIREFFLLISKKNGKSTDAAGIMLTALIRNWRNSAEFLILAPTLEVANNSFFPARDMIRADPELEALLHVQEHLKLITHRVTKATLKVVAADSNTVSGKKATGVLIDELWLFGKQANAENMLREATGGIVSRPEGFTIFLSTQADEPPAGVFKQKLEYFRGVRDGTIVNNRALPVIYEFPKEMIESKEYLKPENFHITNPNLGLSVDEEWIIEKLAEAQQAGETSLRGFLAKHLNVEIGVGMTGGWVGAEYWEGAGDRTLTLDELIRRCDVAVVGVDGGGLDDLMGVAVIGRERETRNWLVFVRAFANRIVLKRRKDIASRLGDFELAGELTIVERPGDDITAIVEIVKQVADAELLPEKGAIGLDPVGIGSLVDAFAEAEFTDDQVVAVSQGYKLMGAIQTTERKMADKTLWHDGSGLMAWCVGNAKVEARGNAILITKAVSGSAKIDPLMAVFNAVTLMSLNPEAASSVYSADRGLVVFG